MKHFIYGPFLLLLLVWNSKSFGQNLEWGIQKHVGTYDYGEAVDTDASGNSYLGGFGFERGFITSYQSDGQLRWSKNLKGSSDTQQVLEIHIDPVGYIYATGTFTHDLIIGNDTILSTSPTVNQRDVFLIKMDTDGNYLWGFAFGGTKDDHGNGLTTDQDGNVYITGSFANSVDFDPGSGNFVLTSDGQEDIFLTSYDPNGNFRWARYAGAYGFDYGSGIDIDQNENLYISGSVTGTGDFDPSDSIIIVNGFDLNAYIFSYTKEGQYRWARSLGGAEDDFARAISVDGNNDIYFTGSFQDSAHFNPDNMSNTVFSNGNSDIYIAKYDSSGNFKWVTSFGGTGYDRGWGLDADENGNVFATGTYQYSVDFDPGTDTSTYTGGGSSTSSWYASYDSIGQYRWAFAFNKFSEGADIHITPWETVYITGLFSQTVDIDASSTYIPMGAVGGRDAYLVKYIDEEPDTTHTQTSINDQLNNSSDFFISQNNQSVTIHRKNAITNNRPITVEIYSLTGQLISSRADQIKENYSVKVSHLSSGAYFVRLIQEDGKIGNLRFMVD